MKKFKVKVEDKVFEVEVEEINQANEVVTESVEPKVKKDEPKVEEKKVIPKDIAGEKVKAPLPGVISSIEINEGDSVTEGQVIFVLEAMKMENEITAPVSGTVKSIIITKGTNVDTDEVLAIIA